MGTMFAYFGTTCQSAIIFLCTFISIYAKLTYIMFQLFLKRIHNSIGIPLTVIILAILVSLFSLFLTKFRKFEIGALFGFAGFMFGVLIDKDLNITNQIIFYIVAFFFGVLFFMAAYNLVY